MPAPRRARCACWAKTWSCSATAGPRRAACYPHCTHRGASLYYGKVEERGIRCCYHGWLFDVQGHCLEQPCEPDGGEPRRDQRAPALVPGARSVRPGLGLPGPAGQEAGAAALRVPGGARRRRIHRSRRQQHRRRRTADHPVQLAAALREPGRSVPRGRSCTASSAARSSSPQMALMPDVDLGRDAARRARRRRCASCPTAATFRRISEAALPTLRVIPNPRVASTAASNRSAGCCRSTTRTSASTWPAASREPGELARCARA